MKTRTSAKAFLDRYRDLEAQLFVRLDGSGRRRSTTLQKLAGRDTGLEPPSAFLTTIGQLKHTAFGELLKAAEQENSPEALKQLLEMFLIFMGVKEPQGVFTPVRTSGKSGRPVSNQAALVYSTWVSLGKPSPFSSALAKAAFGPAYNSANGLGRRKLRDQCRRALERYIDRVAKEDSLAGTMK